MTFQRESTPPILVDALSTFCSRLNKRISLCTKIINSLLIIIPKIFHTYSMTLESFRLHLYFSHGLLHGGMNCVHKNTSGPEGVHLRESSLYSLRKKKSGYKRSHFCFRSSYQVYQKLSFTQKESCPGHSCLW